MNVVIVASGPSAKGFVPPEGVTVIAVNGAIDWLKRADYWFTLDPSEVNLKRMNQRREGVVYCAAVPDDIQLPAHVRRFARVAASGKGVEPLKNTPSWWFWRWRCVAGLSEIPGAIRTGNSAYGALGLAFHLGARKVLLVGVDASEDERVEGGFCKDLSHLPMLFASALPQINMVSAGKLNSVPQLSLKDGLAWLQQPV